MYLILLAQRIHTDNPILWNLHTSFYCKTLNICGIKFSRFTENDHICDLNFLRASYTMVQDI